MQRLGFSTNANREQRKLAVDIAEVLIKWEARKMNNDKETNKQGFFVYYLGNLSANG